MLSQSTCSCHNNLGRTCIVSRRPPDQQADPLEAKLSKYIINHLNPSTKKMERKPMMEAINIDIGGTYLAADSEKVQAIPFYCLPAKNAIHGPLQEVDEKIKKLNIVSDQMIENAKAMRSSPTEPLNEAEKHIANLLSLKLDVTKALSDIMLKLPNKVLDPYNLKNNKGLKQAMQTIMFRWKMRTYLETVFKNTSAPLDETILKNICEYSYYDHQVSEKQKEKKNLENWRSNAVAQYSEDTVFNKILKFAKEKGEECLVLTGYKSETYLCTIREKAKRSSSPTDPLNEAEKDVAALLGLDLDVTQAMSDIMAELPNKVLGPCDLENNSRLVMIMETMFKKKMTTALGTVFKKTSAPIDESIIKNICEYCNYVLQVEQASLEVDHLTIFPHQKKILQVETKSVKKNPLKMLEKGATQCNRFCHLFSKCHGDILIPGYTFIKVVALPMIENQSKLVAEPGNATKPPCDDCKSYIWTQEELEKVDEWMESNILTRPAGPQTPSDYKDLFNRLVGFMSLSLLKGDLFHTEEEASDAVDDALAGKNAGITTECLSKEQHKELTREELSKRAKENKLENTKGKPMSDIDTFILWNSDQLTLILQKPDRVCLSSYFGTGKSLLLKYMAMSKAEDLKKADSRDKSVFVSLGAADDYTYKKYWEIDTVYDIATREQFSNTDVLFYSTKDVLNEVATPQEREWILKLDEIEAELDYYDTQKIEESSAEIASDLFIMASNFVNMVVTHGINEVGDNDERKDSVQDQVNTIITLINDDDCGASRRQLVHETFDLLEMVKRTLTQDTIMGRLILNNPSFSYFFDEVCIRGIDVGDFAFPQLTNVWTLIRGSIWLALRPFTMFVKDQSKYDQDFTAFKTELEQNNVHFPRLVKCMRNTSKILQLATSAQDTESTTSNSSSFLPFNTISGLIPKLVICDEENEIFTRGASQAIKLYSSSQPVVILTELRQDIEEISMSCPERDGSTFLVYNPDQSLPDLEENVKMYLEQPKGIFITTPHHFNGCQAKNVITFITVSDEVRSAILRARVTSVIVTHRGLSQIDELKKVCQIV